MRTFAQAGAPHLAPRRSVRTVMGRVLLALVPGVLAHLYVFGPGLALQILLAVGFALSLEAVMLRLRRIPPRPFLGDLSAPVTAILFALCLPPLAPWWIALVGMTAAIVFAKHLYGGLGQNLFNPAMVGYAVVLVSFPREMTRWLPPAGLGERPGLVDSAAAVLLGRLPADWDWDLLSRATPLDRLRTLAREGGTLSEIAGDPMLGMIAGAGWEWIALAHLCGGVFLLWQRVIPWQVPAAVIGTTLLLTVPPALWEPDLYPGAMQHLFSGGLMLAAFFIATDPVSGCTTPRGRLLFGAGVAVITLAIRRWGAYPDGVVFAILLLNCLAPWIDRYTRPRIFGETPARRTPPA